MWGGGNRVNGLSSQCPRSSGAVESVGQDPGRKSVLVEWLSGTCKRVGVATEHLRADSSLLIFFAQEGKARLLGGGFDGVFDERCPVVVGRILLLYVN